MATVTVPLTCGHFTEIDVAAPIWAHPSEPILCDECECAEVQLDLKLQAFLYDNPRPPLPTKE